VATKLGLGNRGVINEEPNRDRTPGHLFGSLESQNNQFLSTAVALRLTMFRQLAAGPSISTLNQVLSTARLRLLLGADVTTMKIYHTHRLRQLPMPLTWSLADQQRNIPTLRPRKKTKNEDKRKVINWKKLLALQAWHSHQFTPIRSEPNAMNQKTSMFSSLG
jgi:hypothetical protein